jgi:hypothetical protein
MAFVPLVPQSMNATILPGAAASYSSSPVLGPTGTAINLSAWVSLLAQIVPAVPNPTGAAASFGTVTANAAGVITLQTSDSDLAAVASGTARLLITGKPTSGDIVQLLSSGVATIQNYAG